MPRTKAQKTLFAFITVIITVHLFVFYNLYVINGLSLEQITNYGIPFFGIPVQIWTIIVIEFTSAFLLEIFVGSPMSAKIALNAVNPKENKPFIVETAIICTTVCIMCPAMSFLAVFYYNDIVSMNAAGFLAAWMKTIMYNFPLALISQLLFIQPLVRTIYRTAAKAASWELH